MRNLARLAAFVIAVVLLARGVAIANGAPAIWQVTWLVVATVGLAMTAFREGFATASAVALGAHYALALHYGDVAADLGVPIVAALIVVHLDLLDLATALPRDRAVDPVLLRSVARHAAAVFGIGVVAASAGIVVASVRWPSATVTRALGVLGVALVVAIPLGMPRLRR
ncbi:MAG TPA: hypothetical protein VF519_05215 [Mycobacteriales bacterium]|jgi:hypothetical protein